VIMSRQNNVIQDFLYRLPAILSSMSLKLHGTGIVGSLVVVAVVLMPSFSAATATAQMMMPQQQMQRSTPHPGMGYNMFNAMGMSMVPDVRITGISIAKYNELSVNLTYIGNGSAPSITVAAMTNHMAMMNMMMIGGFSGNMSSMMVGSNMMMEPDMGAMMGSNRSGMTMTMMDEIHSGMAMNSQTGTTVIENGWQPGRTISIKLEENGSAFEASDLCVMVFPHIT
jgi:hypothetical protein